MGFFIVMLTRRFTRVRCLIFSMSFKQNLVGRDWILLHAFIFFISYYYFTFWRCNTVLLFTKIKLFWVTIILLITLDVFIWFRFLLFFSLVLKSAIISNFLFLYSHLNTFHELLLFVKVSILVIQVVLLYYKWRLSTVHPRRFPFFFINLAKLNTEVQYFLINFKFLCIREFIKLHRREYLLKYIFSQLTNDLLLQILSPPSLLTLLIPSNSIKYNTLT